MNRRDYDVLGYVALLLSLLSDDPVRVVGLIVFAMGMFIGGRWVHRAREAQRLSSLAKDEGLPYTFEDSDDPAYVRVLVDGQCVALVPRNSMFTRKSTGRP